MTSESTTGPVHFIAHFQVDDAEVYHGYEKGFFPVLKPYGARFLTFDDDVQVLEGERQPGRTVIIEFPSEEVLLKWWNSPEYTELAKMRHQGTTTFSVCYVKPIAGR